MASDPFAIVRVKSPAGMSQQQTKNEWVGLPAALTATDQATTPSVHRLGAGLAVLATAPVASAQSYPTHRVKIITTVAPGGTVDVLARLIAQKLSESLGQSFYVEDIPGGGGKMGAAAAARSAPDGYTILFVFNSFITDISLYSDVPYDPIKDFAPVTLVATSPYVLINGNRPPISVISSLREPKNWPRSSSSPASSRNNHPNPDVRIMSDP